MSEPERSWGVSFFAGFFVLASLGLILYWGSPLVLCFTNPGYLLDSAKFLLDDSVPETLGLWYGNLLGCLYLFIGIGLWRLRYWAYRLLILVLAVTLLVHLGWMVKIWWFDGVRIFFILVVHGIPWVISVLVLIFFLRKKIRNQFAGSWPVSYELPASVEQTRPVPLAVGSVNAAMRQEPLPEVVLKKLADRSEKEKLHARSEREPLSGLELVLVLALVAGGIVLGRQDEMDLKRVAVFGMVWAWQSYLVCYCIFRASRRALILGGAISIGLSLIIGRMLPLDRPEMQYLTIAFLIGVNVAAGFVAGKMVHWNTWFHASSSGVAWALFEGVKAFYEEHGWSIDPTTVGENFVPWAYHLAVLTLSGVLAAGLGGVVAGFKRKRKD